jgi:hypothetical protein
MGFVISGYRGFLLACVATTIGLNGMLRKTAVPLKTPLGYPVTDL